VRARRAIASRVFGLHVAVVAAGGAVDEVAEVPGLAGVDGVAAAAAGELAGGDGG
jgi:hypothetical protein